MILSTMLFAAAALSIGDDAKGFELLKEKGLTTAGTFYVLPEEKILANGILDLRAIERNVNVAQKAFTQYEKKRAENEQIIIRLRAQNRQLRDQMEVERRRSNVDQYNRLVNQHNNNQEELQTREKESFDAEGGKDVRAKLSKARDQYIQKLLALRTTVDKATKRYEELSADKVIKEAVETANKDLEKEYELGPSKAFATSLKTLEKLEAKILSESIPLHKEANTWRIEVVLNGKGPMPMIFDTGASAVSLPSAMAKEIGLSLSSDAQKVQVSIADGRKVTATRATIDTVRVGKFEASNVECLVMPEEFSNAPPLLGGAFINRFNYKMDPDTGKLTLSKLGGEEEPKSTKKTPNKKTGKKP